MTRVTTRPPQARVRKVWIPSKVGPLEGVLEFVEGVRPRAVAVVCHPHPLFGGTMHNKVVFRTAEAFQQAGFATLRFNFRGVGGSPGTHDDGAGEQEDAIAAMDFLSALYPDVPLALSGFSFGGAVCLNAGPRDPRVRLLWSVAPGVGRRDFSHLALSDTPKGVVQGTADDLCPLADLEAAWPAWAEPKALYLIDGAGHFFDGRLPEIQNALHTFLASPAAGSFRAAVEARGAA
ncbi:MAG: alpha/beta hydrolase [Candidatus Eiseniibacteriota bacterium]